MSSGLIFICVLDNTKSRIFQWTLWICRHTVRICIVLSLCDMCWVDVSCCTFRHGIRPPPIRVEDREARRNSRSSHGNNRGNKAFLAHRSLLGRIRHIFHAPSTHIDNSYRRTSSGHRALVWESTLSHIHTRSFLSSNSQTSSPRPMAPGLSGNPVFSRIEDSRSLRQRFAGVRIASGTTHSVFRLLAHPLILSGSSDCSTASINSPNKSMFIFGNFGFNR